jgi:hypothetical protein
MACQKVSWTGLPEALRAAPIGHFPDDWWATRPAAGTATTTDSTTATAVAAAMRFVRWVMPMASVSRPAFILSPPPP